MLKKFIQWLKSLFKKKTFPTLFKKKHSQAQEKARRKRQIAKGQLTTSNGLILN